MNKPCECCESGMTFVRMPAESLHEFRVMCSTCRSFIKWGTQENYDFLNETFGDIPIEPYAGEGAGPRIDQLYAAKQSST